MADFHFLTIYDRDYVPKEYIPTPSSGNQQQFKDPIAESFKNYLTINAEPSPPEEDVGEYFEKFKVEHSKLAQSRFQEPLDTPLIAKMMEKDKRTVYQIDYCDMDEHHQQQEEIKQTPKVTLPDDWPIPLTTNQASYKDHRKYDIDLPEKLIPIRPVNNLGTKEHLYEMLKVRTGESEYQGVIGDLGEIIVREQLHGKIVHPKCTCLEHNLKH